MSYNAEEGIAKTQAKAAGGLLDHHKRYIAYLNERVLVFLFAIGLIGLGVL